jgi:signal transduction histidine kinase
MQRGMLRAMTAFRWGTWAWMAVVALTHRADFERPVVGWTLIGAALAWTIAATVLMERNPTFLESLPAVLIELSIGAALGLGGGIVYESTTNPNVAFQSVRTLGFAWPIAGIITAGVVFGPWAGFFAGVFVAIPRFFSPVLNGIAFSDYKSGGKLPSLISTLVLYALAGTVAGYMARLLRRAQDEVAAARARERVARKLHDGVLQTLAVIERRADDPQLAQMAREQERDLREFLFGGDGKNPADFGAQVRAAGARFEDAFGGRVDVILAPDLPRLKPDAVEALAGAIGEALTNAGKHGRAQRVTVFAEPSDNGDGVSCSVHDDGRGFEVAKAKEGVGLSRSIRGRMEEAGGRVEVDSRPGSGTEVRLWLPCG